MTDLLIKLYDLPDLETCAVRVEKHKIVLRRARAYEKSQVVKWVCDTFGQGWADECEVAFTHQPISCFIANAEGSIAGFACYDCTGRDFFGPVGVLESFRGKGIGTALVAQSLKAMASIGYAYAIIGDGESAMEFYSRTFDVLPIPGSTPGIYRDKISSLT